MNTETNKHSKDIKFLKIYAFVLTVIVLGLGIKSSTNAPSIPDVIRVKGIVVEDELGNDRILLGAPIPQSNSRVRTNTERVKEEWAANFPAEYMAWYAEYNHDNYGIAILDENGFDRILIGDPVPDPNIGKRIGPSSGILINDDRGFERTGYGIVEVENGTRVTLGLDNEQGTEGLSLTILEDGTTGMITNGNQGFMFLGMNDSSNLFTQSNKPFIGMHINDRKGNTSDITLEKD